MTSVMANCTLPFSKDRLKNKSVFITGGADGIGAGVVIAAAKAGAYVTFGDLNTTKGLALERELNNQSLTANFVELDVTQWQSQVKAFKAAVAFSPNKSIDIIYLNAGIAVPSMLPAIIDETDSGSEPHDPAQKVFDVNLLGVVRGIALAVHYLKASPSSISENRERPSIILTGSMVSYIASPMSELYGSSKFGVRGLFKALRKSLPERNIRINMIAPTYVRTSLMAPVIAKIESQGIPLIEVGDVVDVMLRLACDSSINGRCIGIGPAGGFDFGDDFEGHEGFLSLKSFIESGALGREQLRELKSYNGNI